MTAYPPSTGGAQVHTHALLTNMRNTSAQVVTWWDREPVGLVSWVPLCVRRRTHRTPASTAFPVHRLGLSPPASGYVRSRRWPGTTSPRDGRPSTWPDRTRVRTLDGRVSVGPMSCTACRVGREPLALAAEQAARPGRSGRSCSRPLHHPSLGRAGDTGCYVDLYRRADRLVALTEAEQRTLIELGASTRPTWRSRGSGPCWRPDGDGERFRRRHGLDGHRWCCSSGSTSRYKGFPVAPGGCARTCGGGVPDATFVFAGPAVGRSERGVPPRGRAGCCGSARSTSGTKTDALVAVRTVLCVPSTQESFGGVFTEAWSFGPAGRSAATSRRCARSMRRRRRRVRGRSAGAGGRRRAAWRGCSTIRQDAAGDGARPGGARWRHAGRGRRWRRRPSAIYGEVVWRWMPRPASEVRAERFYLETMRRLVARVAGCGPTTRCLRWPAGDSDRGRPASPLGCGGSRSRTSTSGWTHGPYAPFEWSHQDAEHLGLPGPAPSTCVSSIRASTIVGRPTAACSEMYPRRPAWSW